MPRRTDLKRVLIIGSGPIVIGQACEFDYSGSQACKALRAEGLEVILVNSNPATIMTDPELADRTYVEPLTPEVVAHIIERERPDALLPTVGGQTGLNLAVDLEKAGVLDTYDVKLIGASIQAIKVAENRQLFKDAMREIGLDVPQSGLARSLAEAVDLARTLGFPLVIRPSFTLGGVGGGIAYNIEEFRDLAERGLELSPVHEILVEESVIGWKEFELEVMRDAADNFVVICSIDYVVVKIPRWNFEKFPQADRTLTTQMKSVGEVMAIGRTFKEAFMKGVRSLELGRSGLLFAAVEMDRGEGGAQGIEAEDDAALRKRLAIPSDRRIWHLFRAIERGWSVDQLHEITNIDPWFLQQFAEIGAMRREAAESAIATISTDQMRRLKRAGFGDQELALALKTSEASVRERRVEQGLNPVYKRVDTCAAEFESFTPYLYSSYETTDRGAGAPGLGDESNPTARPKVVILGSGPNRIGQGIEFDYCCCHAAFALKEEGLETIMINCNPETVSTDYDTADRLYFQPLTFEDVMAVIETERSAGGA